MSAFSERELYGGAITVDIPQNFIDASEIRQIPDHQEVFLSPTTLTSLIFEINQYVNGSTNAAVAEHHFTDVISEADHLDGQLVDPVVATMKQVSMKEFPTLVTEGMLVSPEVDKKAPSALPLEWQQNPQTTDFYTKVYQVILRLAKYETDLCVRVNVPLREMESKQDADNEELFAKTLMEKILGTMVVKDFGLFAGEEA